MKNLYKYLIILLSVPIASLAQDTELNPDALIFNTTPSNPLVHSEYGLTGLDIQDYYHFVRLNPDTLSLGDDLKWWTLNRDQLSLRTNLTAPLENLTLDLDRLSFGSSFLGLFDNWELGKRLISSPTPTARFSILHIYGESGLYANIYEALSITPGHNVGIGITTPSQKLDVNGNARFRDVPLGSGNYYLRIANDGSLSKVAITSDRRLKENIKTLENALGKVLTMRGVSYTLKLHPEAGIQHGLIAQELLEIAPELVEFDGEYYTIRYDQLSPLLIEALKEQQTIIAQQQTEIESLKQIYSRVLNLEKMLGMAHTY